MGMTLSEHVSNLLGRYVIVAEVTDSSFVVETSDESGFSYDDMKKISEAFDTTDINVGHETRRHGFCETCGWTQELSVLRVGKVTRWP